MGFYEELSNYYDVIFPVSDKKVKFLNDKVNRNSDILDIACGTGNYTIELSKLGHNVDGIDLDGEMIERAINKSNDEDVDINVIKGNMLSIKEIFKDKKYDMVFSLGNSVVHLNSIEDVKKLVYDVYSILNENGSLIIQIINYDRILKYSIDHLPTIDREEKGVKFIRNYCFKNNKVYFNTEIVLTNKEESYKNSIPLLPLKSSEILNILEEVGFENIKFYGDFDGNPHSEDAYATIVHAEKNSSK
ncbi:class I SAM-dependent methyltransferase [Dethiothermospora halolimnae]|uniref:class I SAM-dependent methyltransferase n=1 Tax=Dethiothermospora halolimnae TaxID=3114390 RepID=UPI003CCC132D